MAKRKKTGTTKTSSNKLVRDQMNRAIKTLIRKTVCAVRSAREYKKMLKNMNIDVDEPSGLSIIFTGYSMKVGGSGQIFDDFIRNGKIVWSKEFEIIKFDETFMYGKNIPENDDSFDPSEDKPRKKRSRFSYKRHDTSTGQSVKHSSNHTKQKAQKDNRRKASKTEKVGENSSKSESGSRRSTRLNSMKKSV